MKKAIILDSSALIAFLANEKGAENVEYYIKKTSEEDFQLFLHSINCLEIFYHTFKKSNKKKALEVLNSILTLPIFLFDEFNLEMIKIAGEIKSKYKVSLADAIAVSFAKVKKGTLLTSDHHELEILKQKGVVDIEWVR